jgi:hypothetical protein
MKTWKAFGAGALLASLGILAGFKAMAPDGYRLDGRIGSMTPEHLQRAISRLGLDARSFSYDTTGPHLLRIDVEDYVDGKLEKTECLTRNEIPHIGKQNFMIFVDSRDNDDLILSGEFVSAGGNSERSDARLKKPKPSWTASWSDEVVLNSGVKRPLYYCIAQGGKGLTFPLAPVEKLAKQYPRVIVVYATLESDGK